MYDSQGKLLTQTDANKQTTRFAYNDLGQTLKATMPTGELESQEKLTMKIFKVFFDNVLLVNHAFAEIGLCNGIFLVKNAAGGTQDENAKDDLSKNICLILSDGSVVNIMSSAHFHDINRDVKLGFDWTEIYFFKDQLMNDINFNMLQKIINKDDLYQYFHQDCDFWASSVDGGYLWVVPINTAITQDIFLPYSYKYEEQNDSEFFNMVCNDLLFLNK